MYNKSVCQFNFYIKIKCLVTILSTTVDNLYNVFIFKYRQWLLVATIVRLSVYRIILQTKQRLQNRDYNLFNSLQFYFLAENTLSRTPLSFIPVSLFYKID